VPVGDSRCSCRWDQGAGRVGRRVPRFIESWADLLRSCRRRGMRAQVLAVGDGALGFWKAIREVFPETRGQRCWLHAGCNVLAARPKSAHPGAKAALAEIWGAEDRDHALKAAKTFEDLYTPKWPKAAAKITDHLDVLLAFYDYPAEHWIHLRTTNPIESTFRHRAVAAAGHQGPRIEGRRNRDGVQADRIGTSQMACRERATPGRSGPCRRHVRKGHPPRTTRRLRRRSTSRVTRRSTGLDNSSRCVCRGWYGPGPGRRRRPLRSLWWRLPTLRTRAQQCR